MASGGLKPNVNIGIYPPFAKCKLKLLSHKDFEFKVQFVNTVVIQLGTEISVQVNSRLTQVATGKELQEMQYVLIQRKDGDSVQFHVGFPDKGWYQFDISALPETDRKPLLPCVVTYLINVEMSHKAAQPFPKTYAKFYKDYCYLEEPLILSSRTPALGRTHFLLTVPGALKVAVKCREEWFYLEGKKGNKWEGSFDLLKFKGKNTRVLVCANYDVKTNTFDWLLEYTI